MRKKQFNRRDIKQIESLHLTPEQVANQLKLFEKGTSPVTLARPATIGDGIKSLSQAEKQYFTRSFESLRERHSMVKFIPSSGAATRMFRIPLNYFHNPEKNSPGPNEKSKGEGREEDIFMKEFFRGLQAKKFAFYPDLQSVLGKKQLDITELLNKKEFRTILKYLLTRAGLNYAHLPKALLKFHRYQDHSRTPLEEHMIETVQYSRDRSGESRLHFTISPEFTSRFRTHRNILLKQYQQSGNRFSISFSVQQAHTSTIAADFSNHPFRDGEGHLVFRPGGHGALIENLNHLTEDIVFITNIDNIAPDRFKRKVVLYKKILGGYLGATQERIFHYLKDLSSPGNTKALREEIPVFCEKELMIPLPQRFQNWKPGEKRNFIFKLLNRPIRVCGMVKNQGEPGGGPFWVKNNRNGLSLQIIEASQVQQKEDQIDIFSGSSHFNPVDLVCGLKNYRGEKFDLNDFIDPDTYFISEKSLEGKKLKALELPGLWNGAMARWITLFIDVPIETFNPVKTVNDLLRKQHQTGNQTGQRSYHP